MNGITEIGGVAVGVINPEDDTDWPDAVSPGIRRYLTALSGDGPSRLAVNAKGITGEILRVGEAVLPVLVSDGVRGKASILSPLGHHVYYPVEEIGRRSWLGRRGVRALVSPLEALFRIGRLDRVALVNHWLLSGAPEPTIPEEAWPAVVAYLAHRHPRHALVVQDIKPDLQAGTAQALMAAGARPVPTRMVNIIDPADPLKGKRFKKTRYKRTVGERMVREAEDDRVTREAARAQPETLARLYRQSNVERHSALNPNYTAEFFRTALGCETFDIHAWRAPGTGGGEIVAFNIQRSDPGVIYWSTFGAERDGASGDGLYERITATDIITALETGKLLDWGAGADEFKRLRGAQPHLQVEMVITGHLPPHQRAAWNALAYLRTLRRRQLDGQTG